MSIRKNSLRRIKCSVELNCTPSAILKFSFNPNLMSEMVIMIREGDLKCNECHSNECRAEYIKIILLNYEIEISFSPRLQDKAFRGD